jgi:SAM-dependent methyltransferase
MNPKRRYAELYDLAVTLTEDIPFYRQIFPSSAQVVEVGCGTGRITIALGRAGIRCLGTDVSSDMVEVARQKLGRETRGIQGRVTFHVADMLSFAMPDGPVDFLVPYNVLKYNTTIDKQTRFLQECATRLAAHGRVVIHCDVDGFDPATIPIGKQLPLFHGRIDPTTGHRVDSFHIVHEIDVRSQVIKAEAQYVETLGNGQTFLCGFTGTMRMLRNAEEVPELCRRVGLTVTSAWGDFDKAPLTAASKRAVVIAEKR